MSNWWWAEIIHQCSWEAIWNWSNNYFHFSPSCMVTPPTTSTSCSLKSKQRIWNLWWELGTKRLDLACSLQPLKSSRRGTTRPTSRNTSWTSPAHFFDRPEESAGCKRRSRWSIPGKTSPGSLEQEIRRYFQRTKKLWFQLEQTSLILRMCGQLTSAMNAHNIIITLM